MKISVALAATVVAISLTGCGGGGGGGGGTGSNAGAPTPPTPTPMPAPAPTPTIAIQGTAATGRAIENATVVAKCLGASASATTAADGTFLLDVAGALPCMLEATNPADGTKLHSLVPAGQSAGYANITPLTTLLTTRVLRTNPASFFTSFNAGDLANKISSAAIELAQRELTASMKGIVVDTAASGDFLATPFKPATSANPQGGDAADKVLDAFRNKVNQYQFAGMLGAAASAEGGTDLLQQMTSALLYSSDPRPATMTPIGWRVGQFISSSSDGLLRVAIAIDAPDIRAVTVTYNGVVTPLEFTYSALVPLTRGAPIPGWVVNNIPLPADLVQGRHPIVITATDAAGHTGSYTAEFVSSRPATVAVHQPQSGSLAWPSVRLVATCSDDDPRGCLSMTALIGGKVVAEGTNSIDTVIDVSAYEGSNITFGFQARDTTGYRNTIYGPSIVVESNRRLEKFLEAPGFIYDVDATRILYHVAATNSMYIRDRSSGTDQLVFSDKTKEIAYGMLTPAGAAFTARAPNTYPYSSLMSNENGKLVNLGEAITYKKQGRYLLWKDSREWATLSRRDVIAQKTTVINTTVGPFGDHIAGDGTVTFYNDSYNIGVYQADGPTRWLTSDATIALHNTDPVSDGTSVVYKKVNFPTYKLVVNRGGVERELISESTGAPPYPEYQYQVSNGWIAWTKKDAKGVWQAWRMNPQGVTTQLTFFPVDAWLEKLGEDGTLTVNGGTRRWYFGPTDIYPLDIGSGTGSVVYLGGKLNVLMGSTVYTLAK